MVRYLEIFDRLKIPHSLFIGSATLALYGIRQNRDLDVLVTKEVFIRLRFNKQLDFTYGKGSGNYKYRTKDGRIEIFGHINSFLLNRGILERAIKVNGYNYMSLSDLVRFKRARGRTYDLEDIKLIEEYLEGKCCQKKI